MALEYRVKENVPLAIALETVKEYQIKELTNTNGPSITKESIPISTDVDRPQVGMKDLKRRIGNLEGENPKRQPINVEHTAIEMRRSSYKKNKHYRIFMELGT